MHSNDEELAFKAVMQVLLTATPTGMEESYGYNGNEPCVTLKWRDEHDEITQVDIMASRDGDDPFFNVSVANRAVKASSDIAKLILAHLFLKKGWLDSKLDVKLNMLADGVNITENPAQLLAKYAQNENEWFERFNHGLD